MSIVPESLQEQYAFLNLCYFALTPLPFTTEVVLAYNPEQSHPAIEWFMAHYKAKFTGLEK